MMPVKTLRQKIGTLLAGDTATLAPAADNNEVALIVEAFTEDENLVIGDLTLASFDGSAPLLAGLDAQQVGIDPATLEQIVTIKEPAPGWRWVVTNDTVLTEVIYGYALTTKAGAALLAFHLLPTPVPMSEVGFEYNAGSVTMRVVPQPLS